MISLAFTVVLTLCFCAAALYGVFCCTVLYLPNEKKTPCWLCIQMEVGVTWNTGSQTDYRSVPVTCCASVILRIRTYGMRRAQINMACKARFFLVCMLCCQLLLVQFRFYFSLVQSVLENQINHRCDAA